MAIFGTQTVDAVTTSRLSFNSRPIGPITPFVVDIGTSHYTSPFRPISSSDGPVVNNTSLGGNVALASAPNPSNLLLGALPAPINAGLGDVANSTGLSTGWVALLALAALAALAYWMFK
jgi:hypothetical protein